MGAIPRVEMPHRKMPVSASGTGLRSFGGGSMATGRVLTAPRVRIATLAKECRESLEKKVQAEREAMEKEIAERKRKEAEEKAAKERFLAMEREIEATRGKVTVAFPELPKAVEHPVEVKAETGDLGLGLERASATEEKSISTEFGSRKKRRKRKAAQEFA